MRGSMDTSIAIESHDASNDNNVEDAASKALEPRLSFHSEMDEWFQDASPSECEAMTALHLDYRFEADDFRTQWWPLAEPLGLTRIDFYHYKLPPRFGVGSTESEGKNGSKDYLLHTPQTLCMKLNALAIPQGRSVYDRIGDGNTNDAIGILESSINSNRLQNVANKKGDIVDQWANLREELIFQKFHNIVTKECRDRANDLKKNDKKTGKKKNAQRGKRQQASSSNDGSSSTTNGQKRKLWSSEDAGAELFFHKGKRGRGKVPGKDLKRGSKLQKSEARVIDFATTMNSYKECARNHPLMEQASQREEMMVESSLEEWKFLLSTNHSLLFYGVGSKRNLLKNFTNDEMEGDVIEIDGFDSSLTVDGILELLIEQWLDGREPTIRKKNLFHVHFEKNDPVNRSNTAERITPAFPHNGDFYLVQKAVAVAKRIARHVMKSSRPITLVIHSIDGVGLGNDVAQEVLAALVSQSRTDCGLSAIRLVASIDKVDSQLITESHSSYKLNWLKIESHTHRPYMEEVEEEQAISLKHGSEQSNKLSREKGYSESDMNEEEYLMMEHDSIFSVLKSLASTHAESLRQLAKLQLESKTDWVNYTDLLKQCRAARIVQADQQLRLYMGELLDHNILERDKNKSTSSMTSYRIPYPDEILNLIWNFKTDR